MDQINRNYRQITSFNSSNATIHPSVLNTFLSNLQVCWSSRVGAFNIIALTVINNLFLLPLCILILYLGYKQWHRGAAMSHSDLFTCHMVVMELINIFGSTLCCCGVFADVPEMVRASIYCFTIIFIGQMCFHTLTCVERYLAVVHPIIYLGLRKDKGIRIRNITIGCIWILSFAGMSLMSLPHHTFTSAVIFFLVPAVVVVICFCSVSVLCTLIRPGPGEGGGSRQQVDQSKLRAFYTITAILGVLLLRFGGNVLANVVYNVPYMSDDDRCGVFLSDSWFCVPSSLVLPLLFLHRAGKLPCCKNVNKCVQGKD